MRTLYVSQDQIVETLAHLQEGGRRHSECVVLWLGQDDGSSFVVKRVYRPDQLAGSDIFRIPPASMTAVMNTLVSEQLMIAAQVHSHPHEAFHSRADDDWAIVRHVNALSLVVPDFALKTNVHSFMDDTKTFRLTPDNRWVGIHETEVTAWLQVC